MKQLLITLICTLLSVVGLSQNGGQNTENNVLKISYLGWSNGNHVVTLQNKVNCEIVVTYNFDGTTADVTIQALQTITLTKTAPAGSILNAKAKRRSGANCISSPDNGWVEINTVGGVLPVKFKSIKGKRINNNTIEVTFEAEEDNDLKYYVIKVSNDGINYRNVGVVFPDGIISSKTYTITVKF